MFLTKLAERAGLLDILAPSAARRRADDDGRTTAKAKRQDLQQEDEVCGGENRDVCGCGGVGEEGDEETQRQQVIREQLLSGQRERELMANPRFVKNQRVRYYHKMSDTWIDDAHVVGVHLDDGPDKPYYTISYPCDGGFGGGDTDGNVQRKRTEKQTTEDRLEAARWDEDRTWEILEAKQKR